MKKFRPATQMWFDSRLDMRYHINNVWKKHGQWKCKCQRCKLEKYHLKKLYVAACGSIFPYEQHFAKVALSYATKQYNFDSVIMTKRGIEFSRGAAPKGAAPRKEPKQE